MVQPMTVGELLTLLSDIRWEKEDGSWDGVATRKTPKGVTTVAGPKEVGYAVAQAIEGSNPQTAAQIRGRVQAGPADPQTWPQQAAHGMQVAPPGFRSGVPTGASIHLCSEQP